MKIELKDNPSNLFLRTIGELRKGSTASEASDELAKVVREVQRTGKPGEVSLRLKIRPSGDGESVRIEDDVTGKCPRLDRKATSFFTGEDGSLHRDNPNQPEMFQLIEGQAQAAAEASEEPAVAVNQ